MRLLAFLPARVLRLIPSAERGLSLGLVALVVALEVFGRRASSDLTDAAAGMALVSAAAFVLSWHRRYPLAWLGWADRLAARAVRRVKRVRYEVGVDFRLAPPLPRRAPWAVTAIVAGLIAWAGVCFLVWGAFPGGWRDVGVRTSYTLYLAGLMVLWAMLFGCALAGVYLPVWAVDQRMRKSSPAAAGDAPGVDAVALVGYGLAAVLVAWVTPPVYAVAACLLVAVAAAVIYRLPARGDAALVWRAGPGRPLAAVPMKRVLVAGIGLLALGVFDLLLTATGGRLTATPGVEVPMPVTALLGSLAAWLVPGVVAVLVWQAWKMRSADPSRPQPPTVHITSPRLHPERGRVAATLSHWGWRPRLAPAPRGRTDVAITLVPAAESQAEEFMPDWPLKIHAGDLKSPRVKDRLARRAELLARRHLFRKLPGLLNAVRAAVPGRGKGGGYWFAPHWWFVETIQWEEPSRKGGDADQLRPVGPSFHATFGPDVRRHLYTVFRATEIDLIYVERGVKGKRLKAVLKAVFDFADKSALSRKIEDHHFRGVQRVRVMFHEYAPGSPFRAVNGYPEPKFDDVSRFRVLHVFKDRGDAVEENFAPFDYSWEPVGSGVA